MRGRSGCPFSCGWKAHFHTWGSSFVYWSGLTESSEQGVNCNAFMFCQGKAFWSALWVQFHGDETEYKSVGRLLGSHLSLMGMYSLFSFVPQVSLMSCVFFKAHTKPSSVIALKLGKKIRDLPI